LAPILRCVVADGLSGFIGPFPSTSLDESRFHCIYSVVHALRDGCIGRPYVVKYNEENSGKSRVDNLNLKLPLLVIHITWLAEHHTPTPLTKK